MDNSKYRVLVVDDEPAIRNVLRSLLELEGYEVYTASNGLEALTALRAHEVDVVTLGQYLRPSPWHHEVVRFVPPDEFEAQKRKLLD